MPPHQGLQTWNLVLLEKLLYPVFLWFHHWTRHVLQTCFETLQSLCSPGRQLFNTFPSSGTPWNIQSLDIFVNHCARPLRVSVSFSNSLVSWAKVFRMDLFKPCSALNALPIWLPCKISLLLDVKAVWSVWGMWSVWGLWSDWGVCGKCVECVRSVKCVGNVICE